MACDRSADEHSNRLVSLKACDVYVCGVRKSRSVVKIVVVTPRIKQWKDTRVLHGSTVRHNFALAMSLSFGGT